MLRFVMMMTAAATTAATTTAARPLPIVRSHAVKPNPIV
jgi:hypothetical protein